MSSKIRVNAAIILIAAVAQANAAFSRFHPAHPPAAVTALTEKYFRTELYFGLDKKSGEVTDEEWEKFLAEEVTTKFPEGFTVVYAFGQYRDASGTIIREKSRMLILLYPKRERESAGQKIDAIRETYKRRFQQESVLRIDIRKSVEVSF